MGSQTDKLIVLLSEAVLLLESDAETHWRSWMLRARNSLEQSDYSGIEYLLGAYGGMGSFNDLALGQTSIDGTFAWKPGAKALNDRLDVLRTEIWQLATYIKNNHEIRDV
jgi:hypothetical protein